MTEDQDDVFPSTHPLDSGVHVLPTRFPMGNITMTLGDDGPSVTLTPEGQVIPSGSWDEAAMTFWTVLEKCYPAFFDGVFQERLGRLGLSLTMDTRIEYPPSEK
jgi:hypothetical protein